MGELTNLDGVRRKRTRRNLLRQIFALLVLTAFILLCIVFFTQLTGGGLGITIMDTYYSIFGGNGYPVDSPGGIVKEMYVSGNDLVVLNDTNLYIYNKNGKMIGNYQHRYPTPILSRSSGRLLTFDRGGKNLRIDAKSSAVKELTLGQTIIAADVAPGGAFAVATTSDKYIAQVQVYNDRQEPSYTWYSSENLVSHVALSQDGKLLAVGCIDAKGGVLASSVKIFQAKAGQVEEISATEFLDENIVWIDYERQNQITIITNKRVVLLNDKGENLGEFLFGQNRLNRFELGGNHLVLAFGDYTADRYLDFVVLDKECNVTGTKRISSRINDLSAGADGIYLLHDNTLEFYDFQLQNHFQEQLQDAVAIAGGNGRVYYATDREIRVMEIKVDQTASTAQKENSVAQTK